MAAHLDGGLAGSPCK